MLFLDSLPVGRFLFIQDASTDKILDISKASIASNNILGIRRQTHAPEEQAPLLDVEGEKDANVIVDFRNVSFAYPARPEVTVLKNVSLQISQGQTVAVVGSSGSGKSTLLALLERFYDARAGSINVFGKPISSEEADVYRRRLALVPQEPTLYRGQYNTQCYICTELPANQFIGRIYPRQHYPWSGRRQS